MIKDVSLKVASKETCKKTIGKQRPDVSLINQYLFASFFVFKNWILTTLMRTKTVLVLLYN